MKLTDAQRLWLGRCYPQAALWDAIQAFRAEFGTSPRLTAALIADWIRQTG